MHTNNTPTHGHKCINAVLYLNGQNREKRLFYKETPVFIFKMEIEHQLKATHINAPISDETLTPPPDHFKQKK